MGVVNAIVLNVSGVNGVAGPSCFVALRRGSVPGSGSGRSGAGGDFLRARACSSSRRRVTRSRSNLRR